MTRAEEHAKSCPICGEGRFGSFLEVASVPVHVGVVWPSEAEAKGCPRGDIELAFCEGCGFIANVAFDPARVDYELRYDNALHFSSVFQNYEQGLARRLVSRYGIRDSHVIEIGCGSGHFLGLLCELGHNRGHGFDPSHDPEHADPCVGGSVVVERDYYSDRHAQLPADLVCCRHVLEHVADPRELLLGLRRTLQHHPQAVVYFEVPNAFLALRQLSIWDVIYEHCLYFVPESLGFLFRSCGFEVLDLHEAYDGQFLGIEARLDPAWEQGALPPRPDLGRTPEDVQAFARSFQERREGWKERLAKLEAEGRRAVVWGGGAKAVSRWTGWSTSTRASRAATWPGAASPSWPRRASSSHRRTW